MLDTLSRATTWWTLFLKSISAALRNNQKVTAHSIPDVALSPVASASGYCRQEIRPVPYDQWKKISLRLMRPVMPKVHQWFQYRVEVTSWEIDVQQSQPVLFTESSGQVSSWTCKGVWFQEDGVRETRAYNKYQFPLCTWTKLLSHPPLSGVALDFPGWSMTINRKGVTPAEEGVWSPWTHATTHHCQWVWE